jgi:hypothetical protein
METFKLPDESLSPQITSHPVTPFVQEFVPLFMFCPLSINIKNIIAFKE